MKGLKFFHMQNEQKKHNKSSSRRQLPFLIGMSRFPHHRVIREEINGFRLLMDCNTNMENSLYKYPPPWAAAKGGLSGTIKMKLLAYFCPKEIQDFLSMFL
jgi:hypothetical protein